MSRYYELISRGVWANSIRGGRLGKFSLIFCVVDQHPGVSLRELRSLPVIRERLTPQQLAGCVSRLIQQKFLYKLSPPRVGPERIFYVTDDFVERSGLYGWYRRSPFHDAHGLLQVEHGLYLRLHEVYED